jgi:hypothetical protein
MVKARLPLSANQCRRIKAIVRSADSLSAGLRQSRGLAIAIAHEAIAVLKEIPLTDGLRIEAFDLVLGWIEHNQPRAGKVA